MWKIWYRGVPTVCYTCLQKGHVMKDCQAEQITLDELGNEQGIWDTVVNVTVDEDE